MWTSAPSRRPRRSISRRWRSTTAGERRPVSTNVSATPRSRLSLANASIRRLTFFHGLSPPVK